MAVLEEMVRVHFRGVKAYHAPSLEVVRQEVVAFLKGQPKEGDVVDQTQLRRKNPRLYHWLGVHGYRIHQSNGNDTATRDAGLALEQLGFSTRRFMDDGAVLEVMKLVIPAALAETAYQGKLGKRVAIKKLFWQHGARGKQAYSACFNTSRNGHHEGKFRTLIDSLYPSLAAQFGGRSLYRALRRELHLTPQQITAQCREWYYGGQDMLYEGMSGILPDGGSIAYEIRSGNSGQFRFRRQKLNRKGERGQGLFVRNLCNYLDIGVTPADLVPTQQAQKTLSLIAERELYFIFHIALRYDPFLQKMGREFQNYFPAPLTQIHEAHSREKVAIKNGKSTVEADARVRAGGQELLVEVKNYRQISGRMTQRMEKYQDAIRWADGEAIDGKIALLHGGNGALAESKRILEGAAWKVISPRQFTDFYAQALKILLDAEPDFFRCAAIPVSNPEILLNLHELVSEKSHLLVRRGHGMFRHWLAQFLRENAGCLSSGERSTSRQQYDSIHVHPFKAMAAIYGETRIKRLEGTLFFDLETAGFRNSGAPIFILGMAYQRGRGMVTDQFLVRDPSQEKEALQYFMNRARHFRSLVSFNGAAFDEGFLRERLLAHRIPYELKMESIDLYPMFKDFARRHHFPRATLQTYEGTQLGFRRHDDVPGSRIPQIYRDFVYGRDDTLIPGVLHHNQMDLVTMTLMYEQFHRKKK